MREIASALLGYSVTLIPVTMTVGLVLLAISVVVFLSFRTTSNGEHRSFVNFFLTGIAIGAVAGFVGTGLGIAFFCSMSLGNLCGLGGVFLTGPFALYLAIIIYLVRWSKNR